MLASIKNLIKWNPIKPSESSKNHSCLLFAASIGIIEDILFWRKMWLSLSFIILLNIIFFMCIHSQLNIVEFTLGMCVIVLTVEAFETWLKHKHRTVCLKRLAAHEGHKLKSAAIQLHKWVERKWNDFLYLRHTNHTKAFLIINIYLGLVFFTGKYINGYILIYLFLMCLCFYYKIFYPLLKMFKNIQQDIESDNEYEGLIPVESEVDIKLLSIEPEHTQLTDDRQIYDYWKPDDIPLAECSDSSDNSSSLVTNFSMDKMHSLDKDVETSDTSEDEYTPLEQQKEQLQSTLEIVEQTHSWSSTAYNTIWNLTGTVTNMMQMNGNKRQRLSSIDSTDGFEMIDKNDFT